MHRILSAMLAAASCATMAQAQVGPSAPFAQDAPVYTLDQAVSAAGGSAPAAEAATAAVDAARAGRTVAGQIGEHTSELQSLMRITYAVFCLKKQHNKNLKIR